MELIATLVELLPAPRWQALRHAVTIAADYSAPLWLVGGPVRDLVLRRPNDDLDLVVEGNAVAVATAFAHATGASLTTHAAFGTASVIHPDWGSIDWVMSRRETYPHPAALPVVEPAPIGEDLARRDFTINTIALSLTPATWGTLLDPFGGMAAIHRGEIAVLHDRSFEDDPTRILRAARFAGRFHYSIVPATWSLMEAARPWIERTTPARLLHDLRLIAREREPEHALAILEQLGCADPLLITWHAGWGVAAFHAARSEHCTAFPAAALALALFAPGDRRWLRHYPLTAAEQRIVKDVAALQQYHDQLALPELDDGSLDRLLRPFDPLAIAVFWCTCRASVVHSTRLLRYLHLLRDTPPLLSGDDLRRLGVPPGPAYKRLLTDLRLAQLRGTVPDRNAAEQWIRTHS
ncbi:MAG: CCA tRNA nucleotidyltransferase [Herpetosiphon sp.]